MIKSSQHERKDLEYMRFRAGHTKFIPNTHGDTIVEVLIAIAIISTVLAGAFTVTQKSSESVRSSQERAAMLELLQGQVELVRAMALGEGGRANMQTLFSTSVPFCLDTVTHSPWTYSGTTPGPTANMSRIPTQCKSQGLGNLYNYGVERSGDTFTFTGWWDSLGGGVNSMDLSYRVSAAE